MDCAPLNLAHFHERRAQRFMRDNRYDDATKAVETSLLYLQDAYKTVTIAKSLEVLETQKWEYERKLLQIQMRKLQYERAKTKEIVPSTESNSLLPLRGDNSLTAQYVAKSIDKTIQEFDAKQTLREQTLLRCLQLNKENQEPEWQSFNTAIASLESSDEDLTLKQSGLDTASLESVDMKVKAVEAKPTAGNNNKNTAQQKSSDDQTESTDDLPALAPLELPAFDFDVFNSSSSKFTNNMAECFQK